ncbi:MAG: hypothetical protein EOO61_18345 [Hymenobacter sp.]|nr:MAG: hypothetical protein EOO61_18345 [Hymenobacter sp.]
MPKQDLINNRELLSQAVDRWQMAEAKEKELRQDLLQAEQAFDFLLKRFNEWQLVGQGEVRKVTAYPEEQNIPFPTDLKHAFDPMPDCRRPAENFAAVEKEKVFLFTNDKTNEASNFTVYVFNPRDSGKIGNDAFIAKLAVTTVSNRYLIDLYNDGLHHKSRGGSSLAMDYVISRANRCGIEALYGQLIPYNKEIDRIRLSCFYGHKYSFTYEPSSNTLTKFLA